MEDSVPKRSKSQIIGEEVVPRWQLLLNPKYVFRPETPDFGLDGEIEEWVEAGAGSSLVPTGLRYRAQLKGSEEARLDKALRVHIKFSTTNYWRAQALPVLLVLYHKPTSQFFVRWFHTFDPYDGGVGKKGINFRWRPEDAWSPGRAESLAAEARAFLALSSAQLQLPFAFGLEVIEGAHGLTETEVRIALGVAAQQRPDVVRLLDRAPAAGEGRLVVADDRLVADLGSVIGATLHYAGDTVPADVHKVANDLLGLVGMAFERVGQADIAGRLASSYLSRSTLLKQPAATWDLSGAMARARQIRDALDLADEIDEADPEAGEASLAFTLPVLFHAGSLSQQECERAIEILQRRIERRAERGDAAGEAQACINLANFYRTRAESSRALDLYERALACDAGYAARAYYWEEKAGVLFGVKRYDEAATGYQRALDLGSDEHVRALHADAFLFSGEYAQARAEWHRFFESEPTGHRRAEYVLKLDFVDEIIRRFGLDRQDRRPPSDLNVQLIQGPDRPSSDEARAAATAAIGVDALDPRAWDLLGWAELDDGNLAGYARAMIPVACLLEREVDPWMKAVIFSLGVADGRFAAELLVTGQRLTGGVLLAALAIHARENIPAGERKGWLERLNASFNSIPPDDVGGFAVRFLGEDGTITVIEMPTAGSSQREDEGEGA